jgi:SAM-dependent MidA family methyltransferase
MSPAEKSLRFALSPGPTLASQMLISEEHQNLPVDAKLEVSPSANQIAGQISQLLNSDAGGTGLIIDYGAEHHFSHSLRVSFLRFSLLAFLTVLVPERG